VSMGMLSNVAKTIEGGLEGAGGKQTGDGLASTERRGVRAKWR
jgi:hypothetical protein